MFGSKHINRIIIVAVAWILAFAAIQARLAQLKILRAGEYRTIAAKQHNKAKDVPARRGSIFDRKGRLLASDQYYYDIFADPTLIDSLEQTDSILCGIFSKPRGYYAAKLSQYQGKRFAYIEKKVDHPHGQILATKKLRGIFLSPFYSRIYPYGNCASTILGTVDLDGKGIAGIERSYDSLLSGIPAQKIIFCDAFGQDYPLQTYSSGEAVPGNDVYLTIDIELQQILENELRAALENYAAQSCCGILIDPVTGEILAMASLPDFDPNKYSQYQLSALKNRNISDPYEPGSIFKLVTFAAVIAESAADLEDSVDTHGGQMSICGRIVKDVHSAGRTSGEEMLIESSNVGTVLLAQNLTKTQLYNYICKFGFGTATNIDLPSESYGILRKPENWWGTSMATLPMGYEISVTPLQVACAYSSIANDGNLMRPFLVSRAMSVEGDVVFVKNPITIRKVVPQFVSEKLTELLRRVVTDGTGKTAKSELIQIAGKTGTSHKSILGEKGYHASSYYASFAGFAPYDDPYVAGMIVVDEPKGGVYFGGSVSAPIFKTILEKAVCAGIFPAPASKRLYVYESEQNELISVPELVETTPVQAREILHLRGLEPKFVGKGNTIISQVPNPGEKVKPNEKICLTLGETPTDNANYIQMMTAPQPTIAKICTVQIDSTLSPNTSFIIDTSFVEEQQPVLKMGKKMPQLCGLPLRKAIEVLSSAKIVFSVRGHGFVEKQHPVADSILCAGETCIIECAEQKKVPNGKMLQAAK